MTVTPNTIDALIVGGGPSGATVALLLARAGMKTLLVDHSSGQTARIAETLPPAANALLNRLGFWESFRKQNYLPSEGITSLWGRGSTHVNDFFLSLAGPGWNIDRVRFDSWLLEQSEIAGAEISRHTRVLDCNRNTSGTWEARIDRHGTRSEVCARFLIDASGRGVKAALRGLPCSTVMDGLIGVVIFSGEISTPSYTLIEAVDEGWFYSSGLSDGRFVVVYFTDADIYARHRNDRHSYVTAQLEKAPETRDRVGSAPVSGRPRVVSASTIRRERVCGDGWITVGDAALAFDPLSSLGLYKGLDSADRAHAHAVAAIDGKEGCSTYQVWSDEVFKHYLRNRHRVYSFEQRWRSLFWSRRQEGLVGARPAYASGKQTADYCC